MYGNVENMGKLSSVPQISNSACNNKYKANKRERIEWCCRVSVEFLQKRFLSRRTLTARGIFNWTRPPSQYWNSFLFFVLQDCHQSKKKQAELQRSILALIFYNFCPAFALRRFPAATGRRKSHVIWAMSLHLVRSMCDEIVKYQASEMPIASTSVRLFSMQKTQNRTRYAFAVKSDISWKPRTTTMAYCSTLRA